MDINNVLDTIFIIIIYFIIPVVLVGLIIYVIPPPITFIFCVCYILANIFVFIEDFIDALNKLE